MAVDFIKTVEAKPHLISHPTFVEEAHDIFNKLMAVDTQSAVDFDFWVKEQLKQL